MALGTGLRRALIGTWLLESYVEIDLETGAHNYPLFCRLVWITTADARSLTEALGINGTSLRPLLSSLCVKDEFTSVF